MQTVKADLWEMEDIMNPPYRSTYKMILITEDGREVHVGNFERLDEASAFIRTHPSGQNRIVKLYKYNREKERYDQYEKWASRG